MVTDVALWPGPHLGKVRVHPQPPRVNRTSVASEPTDALDRTRTKLLRSNLSCTLALYWLAAPMTETIDAAIIGLVTGTYELESAFKRSFGCPPATWRNSEEGN